MICKNKKCPGFKNCVRSLPKSDLPDARHKKYHPGLPETLVLPADCPGYLPLTSPEVVAQNQNYDWKNNLVKMPL